MASTAPTSANWDLTYACQLRCGYCYSESGRRPSSQLPRADLLRIADTLAGMGLRSVHLSGGEPLLVPGLAEIVERLRAGGAHVVLYTNGLLITDDNAAELGRLFARIRVGVDGATAEVHDHVRGRQGSFEGALAGLAALDRASAARRAAGGGRIRFGVETIVVRSNLHQLEAICADVVARFPEISFVRFGLAIPSGLGAERSFAGELLTDDELAAFRDPALAARLRAALPPSVKKLQVNDNFDFSMDPERPEHDGGNHALLHVEADGSVRPMPIYEGTVGNILRDPPGELWARVLEGRGEPGRLRVLRSIRGLDDWAAAARALDRAHASPENLARIERRSRGPAGD
jgi:MoaA/NifB/PqqE/SkfB family radical SAM enzyme